MKDIPEIPEFCPVFPWIQLVLPTGKGRAFYPDAPSLDRIDSNQGYAAGNVLNHIVAGQLLRSNGTLRRNLKH